MLHHLPLHLSHSLQLPDSQAAFLLRVMPPKARKPIDFRARALKAAATRARNRAAQARRASRDNSRALSPDNAPPQPQLQPPAPPENQPPPDGRDPDQLPDENPHQPAMPPVPPAIVPPVFLPPIPPQDVPALRDLYNEDYLMLYNEAGEERRAALLRGIADLFEHHRQHPEPLRDLSPGKLLSHCHSHYCSHSHCHSHSHCSHSQLPCHYQF